MISFFYGKKKVMFDFHSSTQHLKSFFSQLRHRYLYGAVDQLCAIEVNKLQKGILRSFFQPQAFACVCYCFLTEHGFLICTNGNSCNERFPGLTDQQRISFFFFFPSFLVLFAFCFCFCLEGYRRFGMILTTTSNILS